jgi:hypothetical protein
MGKCAADGVDSRFRGNDHCFDRDPIPNDTSSGSHRFPQLQILVYDILYLLRSRSDPIIYLVYFQ